MALEILNVPAPPDAALDLRANRSDAPDRAMQDFSSAMGGTMDGGAGNWWDDPAAGHGSDSTDNRPPEPRLDSPQGPEHFPHSEPSLSQRLTDLAALHATGQLSDTEYELAKREELARAGVLPAAPSPPTSPHALRTLVALAVGLVIVILAIGAFAFSRSHAKHTKVRGTFTISNATYDATNEFETPNYQSDGVGGCEGDGGYGDLNSITQVVVTDDHGKEVARTELGQGVERSDECVFTFTFDVKKGPKYYVVTVGHRGSSQYSFDEIQTPDAVALVIGTQ